LPLAVLGEVETLYANDFYLGPSAHPCDMKSSVSPTGAVRSGRGDAVGV